MKKLIAVMVAALALAACKVPVGSADTTDVLTTQQTQAIQTVNNNLKQLAGLTATSPVHVLAVVKPDAEGNTATFVFETTKDDANGDKYSIEILVLESPKGELIGADVMIPSGMFGTTSNTKDRASATP